MTRTANLAFSALLALPWAVNVMGERVPILNGAGATFPAPLYRKWIEEYHRLGGPRIRYQAVGSGMGIKRLLSKTVDFGATDIFLSDDENRDAPADIIHLPTCIGAVAVIYNLPGTPELKLTPELIADIYLGKITRWSDTKIAFINPDLKGFDSPIKVVRRSDSSGTTYIFTSYLSGNGIAWAKNVGTGKTVSWPIGFGADGNAGVASLVKKIPGSVGYVELTHAIEHGLPTAAIRNKSNRFIRPSVETASKAGDVEIPPDARKMIIDTDAPDGYPISSFSYMIVYKEQAYDKRSRERAVALMEFLRWSARTGQKYNAALHYAPLPENALRVSEELIGGMTYEGEPLTGEPR